MEWFWLFLWYSFLGYLLEKAFAAMTLAPQQVRKCRLVLPICPVYGLGMLAVLALPAAVHGSVWRLGLWGAAAVTAVEFAVHWLYEKVLGVRFWDYGPVPGDVGGRVCLPFSAVWGVLVVLAVRFVQPWAAAMALRLPPALTYGALLLFTADTLLSFRVLRRGGDVGLMSVGNLMRALEA